MPDTLEPILPGLLRHTNLVNGVNTYVLDTGMGRVLIDPAADVTPALTGPVTDIFVTHVQIENSAGCLNYPAARVHVPAGDEYLCHGPAAFEKLITNWQPPWDWATRGNYTGNLGGAPNERPLPAPVALAESLRPGSTLCNFEILATPGHGKNAVTLLTMIDGQRVAFCGDLMYGSGQLWNWFDLDWDYGAQTGQRTLLTSVQGLHDVNPTRLCSTHGPLATDFPQLITRLQAVLAPTDNDPWDETLFTVAAKTGRVAGFRELLPNLLQWTDNWGNCAALLSNSGHALLVDDGLCQWLPLPERAARHRQVMADLKRAYRIPRIELVIPTHYHGDHVENIPEMVAIDGCEVLALDVVAAVLEHPERYRLACMLPWYGTNHQTVQVDRHVSSGTRIQWRDYELEIFHLGGQTYYHAGIAVTVDSCRVLFTGDSLGLSPNPEPILCYNDCEPTERGWLYAIDRVIERHPNLLVCGHGGAVRDPLRLLERKRRAWQYRIEQFRALSPRASLREFFDPFWTTGDS